MYSEAGGKWWTVVDRVDPGDLAVGICTSPALHWIVVDGLERSPVFTVSAVIE